MKVTLLPVLTYAIGDVNVRDYLQEFPTLLAAQRAMERQQVSGGMTAFGEPMFWAFLDKSRTDIDRFFRDARSNPKLEFLPDEVWIVSSYGAVRRFPHPDRAGKPSYVK